MTMKNEIQKLVTSVKTKFDNLFHGGNWMLDENSSFSDKVFAHSPLCFTAVTVASVLASIFVGCYTDSLSNGIVTGILAEGVGSMALLCNAINSDLYYQDI